MKKTVRFTVLFTIFLLFAGCASSKVEEVNFCNTFDDDTFSLEEKQSVVNIEINDELFQFMTASGDKCTCEGTFYLKSNVDFDESSGKPTGSVTSGISFSISGTK